MRYKVIGEHIIDTTTNEIVETLSIPQYEDTLTFECKIMNGELVPNRDNDILIWAPA